MGTTMTRAIPFILVGCLLFTGHAQGADSPLDYEKVYKADSGSVGYRLVRYVLAFGDPCLTVQFLRPVSPGVPVLEKRICSLGKARFDRDFSSVDFKKIDFGSDQLKLEISFSRPTDPQGTNKQCTIAVAPDAIGDLRC